MSGDPSLVSVITTVYNSEKYLKEALDSIMAQDYTAFEMIVVDDGSTDKSSTIIHTYPAVKYIRKKNEGDGIAKNIGIKAARGDFIAFLDYDDVWPSYTIKEAVNYLHEHTEVDCVLGQQQFFLEEGRDFPEAIPVHLRHDPHIGFGPGSLMTRKNAFTRFGLFDPQYSRCSSDTEWFFRARDNGLKIGFLDKVLLHRRIHDSNVSFADLQSSQKRRMQFIKASIDRKRQRTKIR